MSLSSTSLRNPLGQLAWATQPAKKLQRLLVDVRRVQGLASHCVVEIEALLTHLMRLDEGAREDRPEENSGNS
ncbi:hypothetical protein ONA91_25785 [Micromonospora sp. DR5-3]|uniref:hypothetical protein n=1 Tax=unclassified Micromonospora TaxID=2617518 RepID=UPI0011DB86E3|nr:MULTISPECIES: hypothetical protein [unclassified Micromonospora]MCW3817865.1 hypothetical protein [Micromonospora sp. DR5-3]TYC22970.1 hypothetical protein FXF52_18100 [Micromonospora sp. MP36]